MNAKTDLESKEAKDQSDMACQLSKRAYTTGKDEDHDQAARMLRMAGLTHNYVADLLERAGDSEGASQERSIANEHNEDAKRHDRREKSADDGRGEARARSASDNHPFLLAARTTASTMGCNFDDAIKIVARRDFDAYQDFLNSRQATAKAIKRIPSGCVAMGTSVEKFENAVNELTASGKSYEEAVSIVGSRSPDLATAYRRSMVKI